MHDEFFLNPTLEWSLSCVLRRTELPKTHLVLTPDTHPELVRWLLAQLDVAESSPAVPPSLLRAALSCGLVVREPDIPPADIPFCCPVDAELLGLVPRRLYRAACDLLGDRASLELNRGRVLQRDEEVPAELLGRVGTGPELWAHLDEFEPLDPRPLSTRRPILWVCQPNSGVLQPEWCSPATLELLAEIEAGKPLTELDEETLLLLVLAEIVIPRSERGRPARHEAASFGHGYLELGPIVAPLEVAALRRHFRHLRRAGHFTLDENQVRHHRAGIYCEGSCMLLQRALTPRIAEAVGSPVAPSYAWINRYLPGAVLTRHRDRPQCRWNVSFCIDADGDDDVEWPLSFDLGETTANVNLQLGEAVLYSGTETPHWRDELVGDAISVVFFHYVPADFAGSKR